MVHIILAGGGSAGHTSPLIATAQRLKDFSDATVSCLGTADKLEARVIPAAGLDIDFIARVPMPRRPSMDLVKLPGRLASSVSQTRSILKERQARAVVGFGGYVCPPAYLAASLEKLPIVLHEGNAIPGLANKLGSRMTKYVATTYPDTALANARLIGMPMRSQITELDRSTARPLARARIGLKEDRPTLLVSGGSLGARSINNAITESIDNILAQGWDVIHIWGLTNFPPEVTARKHQETDATYLPLPFVDAMEDAYAAADMMLCRSGSNTVNEVGVLGLPAIFVPLPHGNGEQARNADALVAAGGGILIPDSELTAARLCSEIAAATSSRRYEMTQASTSLIAVDAAEKLALWALEVARR
ncbi:MAG: undecaprenyldiphospho-muramoylpentapeptide beta-N-acetylglucosaminyltransferase [Propionibacteriaceae bacterium]